MLSPIGSETIASIVEGSNASGWFAIYALSGPSEFMNFAAIQPAS